jgi:hypothetical protein
MREKDMLVDTACHAIQSAKCLEIRYDGYSRVVEVHAVGLTKDGNAVMRVWQVRGGSAGGESVGWKLLRLEEVSGATMLDEHSAAPRTGFKRRDKAIARMICEI